ncbi:MAG: SgcJ/EcaC family oxidoreductase [Gemmatimonadales bacterium]|nr:SgcJ/EcaC family oxidoreductase [Gemmatimonadales bacterium]NIQ99940.1 SgcJ/EcaC family oxidoreductase [Gemmatimonadales bacterium]NIS64399.1 SgcJ/EcaC family oxidoreductase [Gemmatimonadales bacterium]
MSKPCSLTAVIAALAVIACTGAPRVDTAAEADAVRQRYAHWLAAENRRDLETSVSFLTDDAVIQVEGAPAMTGRDAAREVWSSFFQIPYTAIEDVELRTVVVAASGDLAYDIGNWRIVVPSDAGTREETGKSTIVWQKRDGEWMAVVITFTRDAPPEPPQPSGN